MAPVAKIDLLEPVGQLIGGFIRDHEDDFRSFLSLLGVREWWPYCNWCWLGWDRLNPLVFAL